MERTGFQGDLLFRINLDHHQYLQLRNTAESQEFALGLKTTLHLLKDISKENNIDVFLASEELLLSLPCYLHLNDDLLLQLF